MISDLNRITSKRRTRMGKTKRRCGAWIVTLALLLSLLPTSALAAGQTIYTQTGAEGDGSSERPYANFEQALAAAQDGDTIVVRGKSTLNEKENEAAIPCVINKAITILGEGGSAALNVRTAGIVLGADVTITNIELNFANKYHNAIFANGHSFTAINVTRGSGSREVHLFAGTIGAAAGLSFTATAGTNAAFTLQNSEFGNIYAGSVADNSSITMNVDISNSKAIGNIYGSGAQEYKPDVESWFDKTEPDPPVANTKYTAGDATVTVDGSTTLIVDGSGAKSMNVIVRDGKNRQMTLSNVTALTAQGGQVKVASINENAHVTLLNSAELDLSGAATGTDVKLATLTSSNGTGKLILGKSHLLTIASTMQGTFALETPGSFQNASGEAAYDHTYIKAYIANDATVNFTPHSTQSTMQLVKIPGDETAWTTWKTTAAPTVPTTVSKFETTASSVSTDSDALQNGGITIPVTWESSAPDSPFKSLSAIPFHYAVTYNGVTVESVDTENGGMYESSVTFANGSVIWITAGDASEQDTLPDRLEIGGTLTAGVYTITIYAPKADGSKIQLPLTLTVTDGTEAATATELTAPAANAQYTENDSVTLTAKVTSNGQPVGKGEVVFWINGTALGTQGQIKAVTVSADGMASTTVNASAANHFKINETNTVKASYRGVPGDYDVSDSAEVTITVSRAATPTYTLHFDVNGGAANPAIPDQEVEVNAKPVKPADPTRTGYTFLGWKTGADFVDWDTFTMPEANVTFTAAWEANTYTIRYDANGETTTPASIAPQQYVYDTADAKLTAEVFASDTKDFLGWSLSNTATTASYTKASLIDDALKAAMVNSVGDTVTLYAVWKDKPVADVTVTFDAQTNGGELADGSAATQTGKPGMDLTLPSVKDRIGFNFTGWWTASADGTQITAPAVFPNANATYFAQWAEKAAVEVTFTSGDGVWNDNTTGIKNASTRPGLAATVPGTVSRAGYTFEGWQSDNNAYQDLPANAEKTDTIKEGQAVHYTSKWRANTYSIHFEKNSPDATGTADPIEYIYDTPDVKLTTEVFTSTTHKMLGWSLDRTADTASYASGAEIDETLKNAMVNSTDGTVTLYAIWADKDAVTMTFNAGEGIFADNSKEKIESVRPGQQNPLPAAPTRDGYTFNGWASDSVDYPGLSKDATQTPVAIDGKNVTYTAKWVKNPTAQYTVTFRAGSNGSFTNANDPLISQSVENGKTVTGTPDITADRNYRFAGWQIGGAGTVYTRAQVMAMAITDDTVFIASYTYNGGNSGGGGGSVTGYVIKASAGANGSISPSGSVSVSAGGNKSFTITANAGYKISDVLVDGKSVGAVDSYMFEKVRANHTIEVLFAKEGSVEDPKISGVADWLNTEEHVAFMTGYENGTFGAENAVTRAQVAQMFFNLLKDKDVRITVNFADVSSNAWYAKAVNTLGSLGIVSGVGDNCFDPNRAITRAEFTAIAARFAKANETGSVRFSDVPVNAWYYNAVLTAVNYGWITGVGDSRFAPSEQITRAEAATIVNRMLARSADKAYVDATALRQFPDLSTSHWAYYQIMEASNAHGHRTNADGSESWTNLH